MKLDIKIPIGLLFSLMGIVLTIYGLVTNGDTGLYARSLGYNVNLYIGIIMVIFGGLMLYFSRKSLKSMK